MYFRLLSITMLLFSQLSFANGRGPAVEDFVGIEVDHPEGTPQGTEGLFNFEKDIQRFESTKGKTLSSSKTDTVFRESAQPNSTTTAVAIIFILGLPVMIWFIMMNHLRQKAHAESASNIEVLEKYRREKQEAKKAQDEYKKVS